MRVAIVGAGAIGCTLGASLADRGHDVTLVGRGEHIEAISRDGLLVGDARGHRRRYRLSAVTRLADQVDLILLTVKTQDVASACAEIRPIAGDTPVVAMQNGIQGDHLAAGALGPANVVGAVVMCAATYLQPGEVSLEVPGWLVLGELDGAPSARTRTLARALGDAVPTYLTSHLERVRWSKLVSNLNNALCAATGLSLPELAGSRVGRAMSVCVMREGAIVARASGIHLDHGLYGLTPSALRRDPTAGMLALLQSMMPAVLTTLPDKAATLVVAAARHSRLGRLPVRGSTWQSIARGRPSELEYLNGEIVRRGKRLGVPTPYNDHVVALVREVERTRRFASVEALWPGGSQLAADRTMTAGVP